MITSLVLERLSSLKFLIRFLMCAGEGIIVMKNVQIASPTSTSVYGVGGYAKSGY